MGLKKETEFGPPAAGFVDGRRRLFVGARKAKGVPQHRPGSFLCSSIYPTMSCSGTSLNTKTRRVTAAQGDV